MLTRIRNNLSIVLALAACVFAAYAYITNLHYNLLRERMGKVEMQSTSLELANKRQLQVIDELTQQRAIDSSILQLLSEQRLTIEDQGKSVRSKLEELAKNDQKIRDLFNTRLPDDSVRMLLEQAAPNSKRIIGSDPKSTKVFNYPLPSTVN